MKTRKRKRRADAQRDANRRQSCPTPPARFPKRREDVSDFSSGHHFRKRL
jgi:hypothetical protein